MPVLVSKDRSGDSDAEHVVNLKIDVLYNFGLKNHFFKNLFYYQQIFKFLKCLNSVL